MHRRSPILVVLSLAACAQERTIPGQNQTEPTDTDAAPPAEDASEPDVPFEIAAEKCGDKPFGPEWKLRAYAQCRSDLDCAPRGRCKGLPEHDNYLTSACFYDACVSDHDCKDDGHCVCPRGHPRYECIADACQDDSSCPAGETCRPNSASLNYNSSYGLSYCTTPQDECRSTADCNEGGCIYSYERKRWTCGFEAPVSPGP